MSKMLLLFTTSQFATTGSRSNLHRSVLHFSYLYIYSGILSKVSAKKKPESVWAFSGDGLTASAHSVSLQVKQPRGRSTIKLVLPIIWRQNRTPLFRLLAADRIRLNNDAVTLYCGTAWCIHNWCPGDGAHQDRHRQVASTTSTQNKDITRNFWYSWESLKFEQFNPL